MAIDFLLRHVLHHRLEDKKHLREVPGLHHDHAELDDVVVREDGEDCLGDAGAGGGGLAAAELDVVLTGLVQHGVDLLVVVVVVVDPQQALG